MQALKGIVFIMTLAIAILMTLIVYGMYQKSQDPDFKFFDLGGGDAQTDAATPSAPTALPPEAQTPEVMAPSAATPPAPFGDVALNLPTGASITSASMSGGRMSLVITLADGGTEVWVVDLATGTVLGRVKAQP